MATRIIEYGGAGMLGRAFPVTPADQFITAQSPITATGTSAQSAAFDSDTGLVVIDTDEQVYVHFASNPTATTSHIRVAAGARAEFSVPVNAGWKVAVRT